MGKTIEQWEKEQHERHWDCYVTMKQWLQNRNDGKTIAAYFEKCPYNNVAIYGAGDLGKLLWFELKDSSLNVKYFIDRSAQGRKTEQGIPIYMLTQASELEPVDAIIVTPLNDYLEVTRELIDQGMSLPTVSLRDIIFEI